MTTPLAVDQWLCAQLAALWGRSPTFDYLVTEGVSIGVVGGLWYGAALFSLWIDGTQPGFHLARRRTLTIAVGSIVAAAVTAAAAQVVGWVPPSAHPALAGLYAESAPVSLEANSFPSQGTALYAVVAAGIYSLRRPVGLALWFGVAAFIALPRLYLGSHYLTDVAAGLTLGLLAYWAATRFESGLFARVESLFDREQSSWVRTLAEWAVFFWMLEVATEFSHAIRLKEIVMSSLPG